MDSRSRTIIPIIWRTDQEIAMYTDPDEAAYCITRIARYRALAAASIDSGARASHAGIADAYSDRLTSLTRTPVRITPDV
ncbi:hypothetical protein ASE90_01605 [Sphingomonas sp. Leaf67]|uniref:hypothetical protein n=1 Tax=Sphingomonas sp. Leaf67 TaxID=1736230 RepID=UPI0006FA8F45|nr:hypothetical protein [Sphingomonas sp. Leaf67]KQN91529.1 hypothetical protein ASE90_01605 [Sphingomonas sp. Leaf67]